MKMNEEKEKLLALIKTIWTLYPALRFSQLLGNCSSHNEDMYYVSDEELAKQLKYVYKI